MGQARDRVGDIVGAGGGGGSSCHCAHPRRAQGGKGPCAPQIYVRWAGWSRSCARLFSAGARLRADSGTGGWAAATPDFTAVLIKVLVMFSVSFLVTRRK